MLCSNVNSLASSGESADVRVDSERCRWSDGLWSASVSYGWMGCHWIWPDSKHTAMEVSLREGGWLGWVKVELTESANYILCFSVAHYGEMNLVPISIMDQPSEDETCISFFSIFPFSVSLSLYCVSELGVIQDYSLAVSACRMVFDHNFYFPFLEKKNYKEITVPTKMISTYQKSCRTSYTNFYCIIVSL